MYIGQSSAPLLNVTQVLLGETGTYNDVYLRPYQTHLGDDEFRAIQTETQNFQNVDASHLASVAGTFLHPKAQPGSSVTIDHGWGMQRLRFMMKITFEGKMSNCEQIITGYTDRADLSFNNELDPNTQFYVNNVITLRRTQQRTANGLETRAFVSDNAQVLRDTTENHNSVSMRPVDVVRTQHASTAIQALYDYEGDNNDNVVFHDARASFNPQERVRLSKRKNALSANYMSDILKAYRTATSVDEGYQSEDGIYERVQGRLHEPYAHQNALLKMLVENTGFAESTYFTLRELRELCPHVDKVMTLSRAAKGAQMLPNQRGQTEGWQGSDNATLIANILATTIPALALDHLLTKVWFTASNETLDGQVYTELNHSNQNPPCSFSSGTDITRQIQAFLDHITHFVMRDITHNNMMGVSVSVRYEALGDTFITVSCNGEPPVDYIVPTFCDSLFSPIVSDSTNDLHSVSDDFKMLLEYNHGYDTLLERNSRRGQSPTQPTQQASQAGGWQSQSYQSPFGQTQPPAPNMPKTLFD